MATLIDQDVTSSAPIGRIRPHVPCRHPVEIWTSSAVLAGYLELPFDARGLVIIANGDGDHIWDEMNARVAALIAERGFATLIVDLLTPAEAAEDAETSSLRFDRTFLAARLAKVARWARERPSLRCLPVAYLASGLCAGAALAAASVTNDVHAVICCAAQVDRRGLRLDLVNAPVLLLVGDKDLAHIEANRELERHLRCVAHLGLLPGSRHTLDDKTSGWFVARAVEAWFDQLRTPTELAG